MIPISLLLLPGLLTDKRLWQPQIDALSDIATARVADLTGADSIAGMAQAALNQAPAERFALAGLSMGGYVAFEILRQAPDRVLALALLDTTARPDPVEAMAKRRQLMALAETDFYAVIATLMPKMVHPSRLHDPAIIEVISAMARSVGKDAFLRQQTAIMGRSDSRTGLAQIQCPTQILCGREDEVTPLEVHAEMQAAIPGAQLAIIEQCAHLSTLGQPEQVSAILRNWLQSLPRTVSPLRRNGIGVQLAAGAPS